MFFFLKALLLRLVLHIIGAAHVDWRYKRGVSFFFFLILIWKMWKNEKRRKFEKVFKNATSVSDLVCLDVLTER